MKRTAFYSIFVFLLLAQTPQTIAQQKIFNRVLSTGAVTIRTITQDKEDFIWFGGQNGKGLYKYDGTTLKSYANNPKDSNSLSNNDIFFLHIDSSGFIWVATYGGGLNRFDPLAETFTHFRHNPKDPASLSNDTVHSILEDHAGQLWVGSRNGLNRLDRNTGKFTRYMHDAKLPTSLNAKEAYRIYEDRQQNLWIGTRGGGLEKFDPNTGKFSHHIHNPNDPGSISSDSVSTIYEDSRGNFWVGTMNNDLQTMDRNTGIFTHYRYDPTHPEKLSGPPLSIGFLNYISFINEDKTGSLWIGSISSGINKYNPATQKITHYGALFNTIDTLSGLSVGATLSCFQSRDGLLWFGTNSGYIYNVNSLKNQIPYFRLKTIAVNSFYKENNGPLWIGTQEGLIHKPVNGPEKKFVHHPNNSNSLSNNIINSVRADNSGNLWLATYGGGVDKLNLQTHGFTNYPLNGNKIAGANNTLTLFIDVDEYLWVATESGLHKMEMKTGLITSYLHDPKNSNSLGNDVVYVVNGEKNNLWAGTANGLDKLDKSLGKWKHYLPSHTLLNIFFDAKGILWVGTDKGLLIYNDKQDDFQPYTDPGTGISIGAVLNIIEDDNHNLWVTSRSNIYKINAARDGLQVFGEEYGIRPNGLLLTDNFKTKEGQLLLGDEFGYYAFYPKDFNFKFTPPSFIISEFRMGNKEVKPGKGSPLNVDISKANEIGLANDQNSFSFTFTALNYSASQKISYRYQLENYDSAWVNIGTQNKAYFFNLQPGSYTLRVRAISSNGAWADKSIAIIISQPWYLTWWGILLQAAGLIGLVSVFSYFRSRQLRRRNKLLEEKVKRRTVELEQSNKNVEQLGQIGRKVTSSLSVENIIGTAYQNVNSLMDASVFGIGIYNSQTDMLDFPATHENGKSLPFYSNSVHDENRFAAVCFNTGKEIIMSNLNEQYGNFIQQLHTPHEGQQPVSLIYLPLTIQEKKLGVITVQSFKKNAYSDVHVYMLRNIANYTAIALENAESYSKLNQSLVDLRKTQTQLVQSEKMASLGELTAGIAHEIQNPLNFVNNFSEVNSELIAEMNQEIEQGNFEEVKSIARNISENEQKIIFHGKRADAIVKGMLQHSRSSSGIKEPTNINALADEYLRLAYHGLRAKDKSFNATMKTDFDEDVKNANVISQDVGRVVLNLITNAFYAVTEKKKQSAEGGYEPTVTVGTKKLNGKVRITVRDNGNGIPQHVLDKIYQPFFTTKPTGEGTGLGLSMSYDIITKAHSGELQVKTKEGEFAEFIITLPQ